MSLPSILGGASALIGMSEAGKRTGYTPAAIRRLLQSAGVHLVPITSRAYAVEETDLEAFIDERGANPGPGRPRKPVETEDAGNGEPAG